MIVAHDTESRSGSEFTLASVPDGSARGKPSSPAAPAEAPLNQRAEIAMRLLPSLGVPPEDLAVAYQLATAVAEQRARFNKMVVRCRKSISEESVHNVRVHCRRLIARLLMARTAVPSLDADSAIRLLKRFLKTFGNLRDVQVQQQALTNDLQDHPEVAGLWIDLGRREQELIEAAAKDIARFKPGKVNKRVKVVEAQLADPTARLASKARLRESVVHALEQAYAEVVRRRQAIDPSVPATVHRVRIAYKKFRYMVESLPAGISRPSSIQLSAMADYQTAMGRIQDVEVLGRFVTEYAQRVPIAAGDLQQFGTLLVKRRQELIDRYLDVADALASFWPLHSPPPSPNDSQHLPSH